MSYQDEVIYYDQNAKNQLVEIQRYSASKLHRSMLKEQELLEKSWERSVCRTEKCKKIITGIKESLGCFKRKGR